MCHEADPAFVALLLVSALLIVGLETPETQLSVRRSPLKLRPAQLRAGGVRTYGFVVDAVDALLLLRLGLVSRQVSLLAPPLLDCFCHHFTHQSDQTHQEQEDGEDSGHATVPAGDASQR